MTLGGHYPMTVSQAHLGGSRVAAQQTSCSASYAAWCLLSLLSETVVEAGALLRWECVFSQFAFCLLCRVSLNTFYVVSFLGLLPSVLLGVSGMRRTRSVFLPYGGIHFSFPVLRIKPRSFELSYSSSSSNFSFFEF